MKFFLTLSENPPNLCIVAGRGLRIRNIITENNEELIERPVRRRLLNAVRINGLRETLSLDTNKEEIKF